jgi:chloramphenicol 3-O phosphotransferase
MSGRIIILNGTSSAGKTTLAKTLRLKLEPAFCYYASDQLADGDFRPVDPEVRLAGRRRFFEGFHRSIPALADAGIDLLVEHIVEEQSWADELARLLGNYDVFWVGVHAPIHEIERRERMRGDRKVGEGRFHLKTHDYCRYHIEVDSGQPLDMIAEQIAEAWRNR